MTMMEQAYIDQRNALIPEAKGYADKEAGPEPDELGQASTQWGLKWDRIFHAEMGRLVRERAFEAERANSTALTNPAHLSPYRRGYRTKQGHEVFGAPATSRRLAYGCRTGANIPAIP